MSCSPRPPTRRPADSTAPAGSSIDRPELLRAAARRERVRRGLAHVRWPAVLPDRCRREGLRELPDHGPRDVGPRLDATHRQRRGQGGRDRRPASPSPGPTRLTPVMGRFFESVADELGGPTGELVRRIASPDGAASEAAIARGLRRDVRASGPGPAARHGLPERHPCRREVQRHPGRSPRSRSTAGRCPEPTRPAMRAELRRRIGDELWAHCEAEAFLAAPAVEASLRDRRSTGRSRRRSATTTRTASRYRSWSRSRPTPSTRSASASRPTASHPSAWRPRSGSSSGSTGSTSGSELAALRFGLPVLYDVVRRFCG